jgi:hypothetical protein
MDYEKPLKEHLNDILGARDTIQAPRAEDQGSRATDRQVGGTHYKDMGVEPWDVVDTWPYEQRLGYYRGGALKYVMRSGRKDNEIQEAGKAIHYLEKLIETLKAAP